MTKPGIVLCVRVDDFEGAPAPGSVQLPCDHCDAQVYVAPSSLALIARAKATGLEVLKLCFICMIKAQIKDEESDNPGDGGITLSPDDFIERLTKQNEGG